MAASAANLDTSYAAVNGVVQRPAIDTVYAKLTANAPLAMILEVSGNYEIVLPVIISNAIAYLISRSLQRTPIFDILSRQDGLDLPSLEEDRELAVMRVEDAMCPAEQAHVLKDGVIAHAGRAKDLINNTDVLASYLGR